MTAERRARLLGQLVQGIVLGALLFIAVLEIATRGSMTGVFRYQGF